MTTKERQERREDRFRCIAEPTVRNQKHTLEKASRKLRREERMARNRLDEDDAEEYRKAANAVENAIAELEKFGVDDE